ncbi:MAG: DUF1780 domain-containing protein [Rudaea sp.]
MTDEMFLDDRRQAIKEAIAFYSPSNKQKRERWVASKFLTNLNIPLTSNEVRSNEEDPPDVFFRDARFEIKEILDPGRRRHDEYKRAYQKALLATKPSELFELRQPQDITPMQIGALVHKELSKLSTTYDRALVSTIDLLFYVNFQGLWIKPGEMPDVGQFANFGWRSISALEGNEALVFWTTADAPKYLKAQCSLIVNRESR